MIDETKLRAKGEDVLLLALEDPESQRGVELYLDLRFPTVARVLSCGPDVQELISVGDIAIIPVSGIDVSYIYSKVLRVVTKDCPDEEFFFDPEIESSVREAFSKLRQGKNLRVTAEMLTGEHIQFLASDILTFDLIEQSSNPWKVLYLEGVRILVDEHRAFYITNYRNIPAILEVQ